MDAEFDCIACNVKRIVIGVTPVARGYEMRSLECPNVATSIGLSFGTVAGTPKRLAIALPRPLANDCWIITLLDLGRATVMPRCMNGRNSARTSPPHHESRKDRVRRRRY